MNAPLSIPSLEKLPRLETLGNGMFGTTYLTEWNGKKYALKIQKILPKQKRKSLRYSLWREIDLFEYINTLPLDKQFFFMKLHAYKIINNCVHKQDYPYPVNFRDKKDKFAMELYALKKSKVCVYF